MNRRNLLKALLGVLFAPLFSGKEKPYKAYSISNPNNLKIPDRVIIGDPIYIPLDKVRVINNFGAKLGDSIYVDKKGCPTLNKNNNSYLGYCVQIIDNTAIIKISCAGAAK